MDEMELRDLGEFRLLDEVVLPILRSDSPLLELGDDCAFFETGNAGDVLAVTCDAAPKPLVWQLGYQSYWVWGWYAVLVNASDLAAAAARPLGIATSVEAPPEMRAGDIRAFFEGVSAACREFGLRNAGGNLRSAPRFECHGTAFGLCDSQQIVTRKGCRPGDLLVAIGDCGHFVASYLKARHGGGLSSLSPEEQERLLRPRPKLREMSLLSKAVTIRAATDNSDGILGALWNILDASQCGAVLSIDETKIPIAVRDAARLENVHLWNVLLFWGDWQVVIALGVEEENKFREIAARHGVHFTILANAVEGPPAIYADDHGNLRRVSLVRNENFVAASFNENIDQHVHRMLHSSLFSD